MTELKVGVYTMDAGPKNPDSRTQTPGCVAIYSYGKNATTGSAYWFYRVWTVKLHETLQHIHWGCIDISVPHCPALWNGGLQQLESVFEKTNIYLLWSWKNLCVHDKLAYKCLYCYMPTSSDPVWQFPGTGLHWLAFEGSTMCDHKTYKLLHDSALWLPVSEYFRECLFWNWNTLLKFYWVLHCTYLLASSPYDQHSAHQ